MGGNLKELLKQAVDFLEKQNVYYGDARYVKITQQRISAKNGEIEDLFEGTSMGVGIRVISGGAWGFSCTAVLAEEAVMKAAKTALEIAKASALTVKDPVKLSEEAPLKAAYKTPYLIDPFSVPTDEKVRLLATLTETLRKNPSIQTSGASLEFFKTEKFFVSTEGAEIEQTLLESGCGSYVQAAENGEIQVRSYPNSIGGNYATGGYEHVQKMDMPRHAERVRDEAAALLSAPECPSGEFELILDSPQLALQIHESCGHATELDRVFGMEISLAGGTFLMPDKLGNFRYGSPLVTIVADSTVPTGLGTFGYDDEGVPAQRVPLIQEGIFVGYLSSRETAAKIGKQSSGAMRAEGWNRIPLIRMVNVSLEPGEWEREALIADTKNGLLMDMNKSWSIDDRRVQFQFGCEAAWEIKNGKIGHMFKNPVYWGKTPDFWGSCNAVCNRSEWKLFGLPNCGKGVPGQSMHVGHGCAPARFANVSVGSKK